MQAKLSFIALLVLTTICSCFLQIGAIADEETEKASPQPMEPCASFSEDHSQDIFGFPLSIRGEVSEESRVCIYKIINHILDYDQDGTSDYPVSTFKELSKEKHLFIVASQKDDLLDMQTDFNCHARSKISVLDTENWQENITHNVVHFMVLERTGIHDVISGQVPDADFLIGCKGVHAGVFGLNLELGLMSFFKTALRLIYAGPEYRQSRKLPDDDTLEQLYTELESLQNKFFSAWIKSFRSMVEARLEEIKDKDLQDLNEVIKAGATSEKLKAYLPEELHNISMSPAFKSDVCSEHQKETIIRLYVLAFLLGLDMRKKAGLLSLEETLDILNEESLPTFCKIRDTLWSYNPENAAKPEQEAE